MGKFANCSTCAVCMQLLLLLFCQVTICLSQSRDTEQRAAPEAPGYDLKVDRGAHGSYPIQKSISSSIQAPRTNFLVQSSECTSSSNEYYFITPKGWKVPNPGPMILDSYGQLIWTEHFDNEFGGQAYDLMVQEYQGEQYLTFWLGDDRIKGHGAGHFYMLNSSYDIVHKVGAANGKFADLHEFLITDKGTALIIVFEVIPFDVRPAGRKFNDVWNQYIWDCLIQEIDINSSEAVFEWRASEHLEIKDSYKKLVDMNDGTANHPYDPWHFNSVEKDELGNYLVSARYTHAVYYISGKTQQVIWTLGGKSNDFQELSAGEALNFAWQHDARFHPTTAFPESYTPPPAKEGSTTKLLTLFDNAAEDWNYDYGPSRTRGLLLELTYPSSGTRHPVGKREPTGEALQLSDELSDLDKAKIGSINGINSSHTVRLIRQFFNPALARSSSQGSLQVLPPRTAGKDSRIIVGYGINAIVSEHNTTNILCNMHFGAESSWEKGDVQSYRALKYSGWVGRPRVPPAVVVKGAAVYVSWNGATEVTSWTLQISESDSESDWEEATTAEKTEFETIIPLDQGWRNARYMRILAINREAKVCDNGVRVLDRGYLAKAGVGGAMASLPYWQMLALFLGFSAGLYYAQRILRKRSLKARRRRADRWKLP